ncbi:MULTISPECIES: hypothetical protein [unclassified Mucilaginibacter]|uniref:CurL C-terminal domain-containing protein n=1 Tax=unclassified Mucilaginibacter TaxID=2617802 RepID=UPI002AC931D9|nr:MULTISPECIES: hypothetical protein [unclassified Mucilaginibacter]MEB0262277.1 hypothetical protein [Mucilaginibacter sp. 10I4]MEB0277099.1 hypothetical protein [Mucilaginibacter sp. 10B2]MEB0301835.1 hypothetical protein [Mucilaginibacter sp. 5C4]WPX25199.1 hypothetical protein RHM67_07960 [Mucilaginibacter sp. 5C4]
MKKLVILFVISAAFSFKASAQTFSTEDFNANPGKNYLQDNPDIDIADVAYTLQTTRADFKERIFFQLPTGTTCWRSLPSLNVILKYACWACLILIPTAHHITTHYWLNMLSAECILAVQHGMPCCLKMAL